MKLKFRTKLFISITILFTLIATVYSGFYYSISMNNLEENNNENLEIVLYNTVSQIDDLYNRLEIAAYSLVNNPQLRNCIYSLNNDSNLSDIEKISLKNDIELNLNTIMFSPNISNVMLYNKNKSYFYYTGYYLKDNNYISKALNENNYLSYLKGNNIYFELPPHKNPWREENYAVISVCKNFSDSKLGSSTLLEIQASYEEIAKICDINTLESGKEIILLDKNLNVVFPIDNQLNVAKENEIERIKEDIINGKNSNFNSSTYSFLSTSSKYADLKVILFSDSTYLNKQRKDFIFSTLFFILILLLSTILILFFIVKKLSKPLNQLVEYINNINLKDNSTLKISDENFDEFEDINNSFNNMVKKFNDSIDKICESEVREANANFFALQAQINPHFLYNTLNAISAASEIYGSEITTKMCHSLSMMMRYTTSSEQKVKLIDEINHTKNYLDLMSISSDGDFSFEIALPVEAYDILLPKLIVQPLVENCFKHAFIQSLPPWNISIDCSIKDNGFRISIKNNGDPFSDSAIKDFENFVYNYKLNKTNETYKTLSIGGLGLKNIYARLSLMYDDIIFKIYNSNNETKIIIERGNLHA